MVKNRSPVTTVADLRGYLDGAPDDMPVLVERAYFDSPRITVEEMAFEPRHNEWFEVVEHEPAYTQLRKAFVIR